jgi:hypothetical protein
MLTHVSTRLDNNALDAIGKPTSLRTDLPNQGLLVLDLAHYGAERSGWIDVRHPVNDGANYGTMKDESARASNERETTKSDATGIGYDRSESYVQVYNHVVTAFTDDGKGKATKDKTGTTIPSSPPLNFPLPLWFEYAKQAWAQAGVSIESIGKDTVDLTKGDNSLLLPFDDAEREALSSLQRSLDGVDAYHATKLIDTKNPTHSLFGSTKSREDSAPSGVVLSV